MTLLLFLYCYSITHNSQCKFQNCKIYTLLFISALRCQKINPLQNGKYKIDTFNKFGATVRYSCNVGYILKGVSERVCQGDGNWSGLDPTCEIEGKLLLTEELPL